MVQRVVVQLASLVFISALFSVVLAAWGVNYFIGALFGIAVQFVGYYGYVNALKAFVALKNKKLENERIKELTFQGLEVTCPCHKRVTDFVPIRLNTANYYKCRECSKSISVYINAETAVVTEPQDSSLEAVNLVLQKGIADILKK